MARAIAGDASSRRGEKESEWDTDAGTKRLPLRTILGSLAESLARSDSLMRRLIPGLAIVFIVILALFRTGDLVTDYTRTQETAQMTLSLMATVVASGLMSSESDLPETGYRTTLKRILADSLPSGATSKGRIYLVADQSGTIVASAPLQPALESRPLRPKA